MNQVNPALLKRNRVLGPVLTGVKWVFALACLAFFLSQIVSTYAFVIYVSEDTIADFQDGNFYFTGLNSVDETVRLLPIGLTGDWATDRALPDQLSDLGAAVSGGRIFVFGGYNTIATYPTGWRRGIYSSTIQSDGTLSPWVHIGDLPTGVRGHRVVMTGTTALTSTAYVLGGEIYDPSPSIQGEYSTADVQQVVINNATGAIVSTITRANHLPDGFHYHSAVLNGNKVYLIGGAHFRVPGTPDIDYTSQDVYVATIGSMGSLGAWTPTTAALPTPLRSSAAALYHNAAGGDTIYVMGGTEVAGVGGGGATPTLKVFFGDISSSGDITTWVESGAGNLPVPVLDHAGVIVNSGELFVIGGRAGEIGTSVSTTVKSALVDANDPARIYNWCDQPTCDRWQGESGEALASPRSNLAVVYYRNNLYTLGGNDGAEQSQSTVFRGSLSGNPRYRYAPSGYYESGPVDLGEQARSQVKGLAWKVYLTDTSKMTLTLSYRLWTFGGTAPVTWTSAALDPGRTVSDTTHGVYTYTALVTSPATTTRYVQYRADMRSITNTLSPRLDWVRVYFDVQDPDVEVFKVGRNGVYQGDEMTYTVHYTVTGGVPAANVMLTETVPAYSRYSPSAGWTWVGGNVYTYLLGTVGVTGTAGAHSYPFGGVEYDVVVTTTVLPDPVLTNVVQIGYPPMQDAWGNTVIDPNPGNSVFTTTTTVYQAAWILDKSAVPDSSVRVSDTMPVITYTLRYTYTGTFTEVGSVMISDVVDPSAFKVITPGGNGVRSGSVITWTDSHVGPNQGRVVTFTAQVTRPLDNGYQIDNRAYISSLHAPLKLSNLVTHTVISTPTLVIAKVASKPTGANVFPGETLLYTITVTDTGGMDATTAVITDAVSSYLTGTVVYSGSLNSGVAIWTRPSLPIDTPWVVTYTSRVGAVSGVTITNTAAVYCDQNGPVASRVVTHSVPPAPMLQVQKTDGWAKVIRGQVLTYTITYSNAGVAPGVGVRLTDTFPSEVTPMGNPAWTSCGTTCRYIVVPGTLAPVTDTRTVTFAVQVKADAPLLKTFTNTVQIAGAAPAFPGFATDVDLVFTAPDVRLAGKTNGRGDVGRGEVLTYTIRYQNAGIDTLTPVILSDTLPVGLVYLGGTPSWSSAGGGQYTVSLGVFTVGQSGAATMTVQVDPAAVDGPLTNTAIINVADEVNTADNTARSVNNLRTPMLHITKSDHQSTVNPGDFLTYTISYSNTGYVAYNVVFTETLPVQVRYVGYGWQPAGGNVYTRSLPYMDTNTSGVFNLFVQVNPGAPPGPMLNNVTVSAPYAVYPNGNVATDSTTVPIYHDLAIDVNDRVGGVHPGQFVTYTIVYTNAGNVLMEDVRITDTLAGGLTKQGGTCLWTNPSPSVYAFTVDSVPTGAVASCTLVAQAPLTLPGFLTNTAQIAGSVADDHPTAVTNNVAQDVDFITGTETLYSDLYVVTLDATPVTPTVGVNTTFVVTVTNLGLGPADDIVSQAYMLTGKTVIGTFRLPPPPPSTPGRTGLDPLDPNCSSYKDIVYVGVYVDPFREPTRAGDGWWNYLGYLSLRDSDGGPIPPGLSRAITNTWWLTQTSYGPLTHQFDAPGWHRVTAQVDLYLDMSKKPDGSPLDPKDYCGWRPSYGHIPESDESNNITARDLFVVPAPIIDGFKGVALPVIVKNWASN